MATLVVATGNVGGSGRLDHDPLLDALRRHTKAADGWGLELLPSARFSKLDEELRTSPPDLLVISTHGHEGGRAVLADDEGTPRDWDPEAVAERITAGKRPPTVVVLNICFSRPLAEALVARGVACVTGASVRVPAEQAISFVDRMAGALIEGHDARAAFEGAAPTDGLDGAREGGGLYLITRPGVHPGALRIKVRRPPLRRRVLVLDAYPNCTPEWVDEGLARLPAPLRATERLLLSDRWRQRLNPRGFDASQQDWSALANAVSALVERAGQGEPDEELVIMGRAPLAAFVHLGQELSGWSTPLVFVNQRPDRLWDVLDVGRQIESNFAPFCPPALPGGVSEADGDVLLFCSVMAHDRVPELARAAVTDPIGGVVGLLTKVPCALDDTNAEAAAGSLHAAARLIRKHHPRATRVHLMVAGPAQLAFLAGRAFNVNLTRLILYQHERDTYHHTWDLPWRLRLGERAVPVHDQARLARAEALADLTEGLVALQQTLGPEQLMLRPGMSEALKPTLVRLLRGLEVAAQPAPGAHALFFAEGRVMVGDGLLQALLDLSPEARRRAGRLFLLHQLLHHPQGLRSASNRGLGRAGLVLEEVDVQSGLFALSTLTRWEIEALGAEGARRSGELLLANIESIADCIDAFDRMAQDLPLQVLPERRLRRILLWALQWARARSVRSPEHVQALLAHRPHIELAPLRCALSEDHDRLVLGAVPETELFVALHGTLLREPPLPRAFSPGQLVEAVRHQDKDTIRETMLGLIERNLALLAHWREA